MVAVSDLPRVNALLWESENLGRALVNLAHGGTITSMEISPSPTDDTIPPPAIATVSTREWQYPVAMKDAIIQQLQERHAAIAQTLGELGVTGMA